MRLSAITLMCLFSLNSLASGGVSCEVKDSKLKLDFSAATSHGLGSTMFQAEGSVAAVGNSGVVSTIIKLDDVKQYWNSGRQLNLLIYTESYHDDPSHEQTIKIETRRVRGEDYRYVGTYEVNTFQGNRSSKINGRITCSVE